MKKLIECVPNFSEGRDQNVIRQITDAIESVEGVSLLDVDPGASTNRTVVTFVGDPDATVEAAFRGIKKAAELIDMRKQKGAHPRMGATDVCPFIPVSNVSWEEAVECANRLGKRVGEELKIPVQQIALTRHDIFIADECFLTGSAAEIIPVVKLDSRVIGDGKPGPLTKKLTERFHRLTRE